MKKVSMLWVFVALAALSVARPARTLLAGDLGWLNVTNYFKKSPVDVHLPESCDQCGHEGCVERTKVEDCVIGEKKVYKTSICHEYVAIPETRYRWQMKWIAKEIPADTCKTVCEPEEVEHGYDAECWQKKELPCGGELHCKTCQPQTEKLPVMKCKTEPGKTTVKVHYWSCVKVPYTVYRQVEKEVCVKQPRCEKVEVPVTRYVCEHCGGVGCKFCKPQ